MKIWFLAHNLINKSITEHQIKHYRLFQACNWSHAWVSNLVDHSALCEPACSLYMFVCALHVQSAQRSGAQQSSGRQLKAKLPLFSHQCPAAVVGEIPTYYTSPLTPLRREAKQVWPELNLVLVLCKALPRSFEMSDVNTCKSDAGSICCWGHM